jgi:hypothetical protein
MPRSKRDVHASGVTRSLGGARGRMLVCVCCDRYLPRDAIAFIRKRPTEHGKHKGKPFAVCGECYAPGGRYWT